MGVFEITFCDPKALKAKKAKKDPIMLKKTREGERIWGKCIK